METPRSILALNRNARNLELLGQFLGKEGYDVIPAATLDAFDAALAAHAGIGLALLDVGGFDQRIWVRCESLRHRDIPFLLLSSRVNATLQQQGLVHGARGVLVKPLVVQELLGLIRGLLDAS